MRRIVLTLLLLAPLALGPRAARAQGLADYDYSDLVFRGVGLSWGYLWPSKVQATPEYTLRVDLGYLGPGVRIVPSMSYWRSDMRESELGRLADRLNALPALQRQGAHVTPQDLGPIRLSDLALALDGQYVWTTPTHVLTYVGLGLGVHALNGQGQAINDTFIEDLLDTVTAGASASGGLEYPLGPRFRVYGELRYTLTADVQYAGLRLGGAIMLPGQGSDAQAGHR